MQKHTRLGHSHLHKGLVLAGGLFGVDQLTKWFVFESFLRISGEAAGFGAWLTQMKSALLYDVMRDIHFQDVSLLPFLNIVMVWNRGVSFGLFSNHENWTPYILTAIALVVAAGLFIWMARATTGLLVTALALVAGGALGNAFDRIRFGAVADFIDLHVAGYHWPAFNVADSAIVIGAFLLMIDGFKKPSADQISLTDEKKEHAK